MKRIDQIRAMPVDEIAKLLSEEFEAGRIAKWFDKTHCKICLTIEVLTRNGKKEKWNECYFQGHCPSQNCIEDIVKIWLESEVEND